jgi:aminopeptidase N
MQKKGQIQRSIIFILICVSLQSCLTILGLNKWHKPAKTAGVYKKFELADSLKGFNGPLRKCFDVNYYELFISPQSATKTLKGEVNIYLTAVEDFKKIQLDLHQTLKINSLKFEGAELPYTRIKTAFYPAFNRTIAKGEKIKLTVNYEGKPQIAKKPPWEGGLVWKKDKNGKPWCSVACENDGSALWWPLKDHIADEPDSVEVSIETDSNLTGVSNGRLIETIHKGEKNIYKWRTSYPINTYNITFYIGDFVKFSQPCRFCTIDSLTYYVLTYNLAKAMGHFAQTRDIFKFYEDKFGNYPWPKDGFKLVESPFEGMEHQTAIAYGNGYKNMWMGFDYIILHETAHEWWGNAISVKDFADVWIHEGFATYSEALYVEKFQGKEKYYDYLSWHGLEVKNKFPVIGPREVNYWDYKDGDRYVKGSVVLASFRHMLNDDELFFNILTTFYKENMRKMVTTDDFIACVNKLTKKDYTWYFKQMLYSRIPPKFVCYEYLTKSGKRFVQFKWENTENDFVMPAHFLIGRKEYTVYPTTTPQEIEVEYYGSLYVTNYKFYFETFFSKEALAAKSQ